MSDDKKPADWKTYDEFAAGIATNRLAPTASLVGTTQMIQLDARSITLAFEDAHRVRVTDAASGDGTEWCEVIEVAPSTYFVDITFQHRPLQSMTAIVNTLSRRALVIECEVRSPQEAGAEPRVAQTFLVGRLAGGEASGLVPHESRDLIGLRTWQTYSPNHTYEHTYLSSQRYCWQCLVGVQRGHGDVDMATYYKFAEDQYLFTFREFLIPVASVFFFNFASGRSTGKFLGLTGAGAIANSPAGALMQKASQTLYSSQIEPV
ncbi:MoaF C-terminal domain-containing protein [Duganella radicis]|uniref:Molybdenum cofactor biosynthesis protein F n=1 Tax=Duganella radicis TaxID=551988 RepID=A0A6L6PD71_9BURK|nr:MoaF C-terminal domain-containing protein [Duganella radicis]MTV36960.1 molybdenum cofactor biosynthesis protein F [Duganella radicis]